MLEFSPATCWHGNWKRHCKKIRRLSDYVTASILMAVPKPLAAKRCGASRAGYETVELPSDCFDLLLAQLGEHGKRNDLVRAAFGHRERARS